MGKVTAIAEGAIIIGEVLETVSEFFSEAVSKDFYKVLNEFAFVNVKSLGMNNSGNFVGDTKVIYDAIYSLSILFLGGCFLFYAFNSLFSYFISKKVDFPWKAFIRGVIFAVLINASSFICFSGVFFCENITTYLREIVGTDVINFEIFENAVSDLNVEEENDILELEILSGVVSYFSLFFISIILGLRMLILKVLVLTLPIFLSFGAVRCTEKIFFMWGKCFFGMLFVEIIICLLLGIISTLSSNDIVVLSILICAMQLLLGKITFSLINNLFYSK